MRKFYKTAILSTVAAILLAVPVLAFLYQAPFTIIEDAGTDYDMFPALVGANNTFMADNGFMQADALDTRVETLGGSDKPHMVADDFTLGAVPVEANSQTNLFFTTGETDLTSMNILTGFEGFITTPDSATLEPGDDFRFELTDTYVNTDLGTGSLVSKDPDFVIKVLTPNTIRADVQADTPIWVQVAPQLAELDILSLATFNSRLYGGTALSGKLYEWDEVSVWVEVAPTLGAQGRINALEVFEGKLYGGTGTGGRLYEWNGVNLWVEVAGALNAQTQIEDLAVFNGKLYGGTTPGGRLFEWDGAANWVQVAPQLGGATTIHSLAVHNGKLYGGTNTTGLLYEWNDIDAWSQVAPQLNGQTDILALEVFDGKLYGSTGATARLFEWDDAAAWVEVAPQLGAPTEIISLQVFEEALYGGTNATGLLYKWTGVAWDQVAAQLNAQTDINWMEVFAGNLYGGTSATGRLFEWDNGLASVSATGIATGEHDIVVGTLDRGDIDTYAAGANIAVNTGAGILPVRLLEEVVLTSDTASVTFSDIDVAVAAWDAIAGVTSRHLVLVVNAASDFAVPAVDVIYQFNGDGGANYNTQRLFGVAAVATALRVDGGTAWLSPSVPGTTVANAYGGGFILVPHAFNTINQKSFLGFGGIVEERVGTIAGRWADTDAITQIAMSLSAGDFATGSTFQLGVVDERYLVEEQILVADGTFTFAGIPQDGGDLAVVGYLRSDRAAGTDLILHEINGDAVGGNYARQDLLGNNAVTSAASAANAAVGTAIGDTAGANEFGGMLATYSQYADAVNQPHYLALSGFHASPGTGIVHLFSGRRNNVAAITQLGYNPNTGVNFKDGSMMSLYRVPRFTIETVTLAAPAASITFSNIPQGYEALQIQVYARSAAAALLDDVAVSFNTDVVAANYDFQTLDGQGAAVTVARNAASRDWMPIPGNTSGANEFGGGTLTLNQYAAGDRHKHGVTLGGRNEDEVALFSARWEDTAPITDIVLTTGTGNNFMAGTVIELVGVMPSVELQIEIDGVVEGAASTLGVDVTDNANDWLVADNSLTQFLPYMGSYEQSGQALHFDGTATSNVDMGAIHDAAPRLWLSLWFKLDAAQEVGGGVKYLFGKRQGLNDRIGLFFNNGRLFWRNKTGAVTHYEIAAEIGGVDKDSWAAGEWFHVFAANSDTVGIGRLRVNNDTIVLTNDENALPNGGDFVIADEQVGTGSGVMGIIANVAVGTDDLTTAEETALFGGGIPSQSAIPADASNIWYLDEGTGLVAVDSGLDGDNGAIDAAPAWEAVGSLFRIWYNPNTIVENTQEASTADAGTALTLDDAVLTQVNDFWNGAKLVIVTTTDTFAPQGESSVITDFDAALDRLTFDALTAVVDAGDTYTIDYGTLIDRASTPQDGRITWGVNPTGVSVTLGSMVASSQPIIGETEEEPARDILPPITVSDWFGDGTVGGSTLTNPIRPLITAMSDNTTLTEIQVWRLMGIIAVLFATVATAFTVRGHQGITAILAGTVLGGLVAFDHNIFPLWTLVIATGLFAAGVVAERSPSL